jgi:alanine racemase
VRQASITINSAALSHNLQRVKQLAPQAQTVCMVKANAYGIGIHAALAALDQADAFGVACLQEALQIRAAGSQKLVTLVEGVFDPEELLVAIREGCECMIHHQPQLDWLLAQQQAYQQAGLKVWIKLNSGMNRLGFGAAQCIRVIQQLQAAGFDCVLAMHFANADDANHPLNQHQIQQLLAVKAACEPIAISCCNSAAIFNYPALHFDYVRPGIMLYGASPFADRSAPQLGLQPVMHFSAAIMAIHQLRAGEQVGYGAKFTAPQDMSVAVVSIGYGDGYPRVFFEQNYVAIKQQLLPVVGRVSMDMITIDISAVRDPVEIGTPVELWGPTRLVDDVAAANGTIGYELLCRMTNRPKVILE